MKALRILCYLLSVLATDAFALQQSQVPTKVPIIWGQNASGAFIRPIPNTSQIGVIAGAASWPDGFPPVTFLPIGGGGTPPFGQDFNGALNQISAWVRWLNAGGPLFYDGTFATSGAQNIGGYPKQTVLSNLTTVGCFWINQVDNNTTNPDSGGANWLNSCVFSGGDLTGTWPSPTLVTSGVTAGTYTRPLVAFDAKGRATSASNGIQPTYQSSGAASGTYTSPTGVKRIRVTLVGGGGGGGSNSGNGSAGGTSSFGGWTAVGGGAGFGNNVPSAGQGGTGGSNGTGNIILRLQGGAGQIGAIFQNVGSGVTLTLRSVGGTNMRGAGANSGAGGSGLGSLGPNNSTLSFAGAGGAGEVVMFDFINPSWPAPITASFVVGGPGGPGAGGQSDAQAGLLLVEEFYD